jgi:uncharacterized protein (TIGR00288 family)
MRNNLNLMKSDASKKNVVALLIDGENMSAKQIEQILAEAEKLGEVTIRRIYGNWDRLAHWKNAAFQYALEIMHCIKVASHKNGSDIALVVGAMDLFYNRQIKHFCIVASDSDYTPLIQHLCRGGCEVLGMGRSQTSKSMQSACSRFVTLGAFAPSLPPVTLLAPTLPMTPNMSEDEPALTNLLKDAYNNASERQGGNEWVSVQQLGTALVKLAPNYKTLYGLDGKKPVAKLVERRKDLFETRKPEQDGQLEVRLRKLRDERALLAESA